MTWTNVGLALLRVLMGAGMVIHGYPKVFGGGLVVFTGAVRDMGFPVPVVFAATAALIQFLGGVLVAAGFATRPAAFLILVVMCVAAFLRHAGQSFGARELALAYACTSLVLMFTGPGHFSVDYLLGFKGGKYR